MVGSGEQMEQMLQLMLLAMQKQADTPDVPLYLKHYIDNTQSKPTETADGEPVARAVKSSACSGVSIRRPISL